MLNHNKVIVDIVKKELSKVDFTKITEKYQFGGHKRSFWATGITVDYNAYPLQQNTGMDHRIMFRSFSEDCGSSVIVHYAKNPYGRCYVTEFCINSTNAGPTKSVSVSYSCERSTGVWRWELTILNRGYLSKIMVQHFNEPIDEISRFINRCEIVLSSITKMYIGKDRFRASV